LFQPVKESATYNVFLGFRLSVGSEAYQAAASNLRFARKHVLKHDAGLDENAVCLRFARKHVLKEA